jgi:hypothetical protein
VLVVITTIEFTKAEEQARIKDKEDNHKARKQ